MSFAFGFTTSAIQNTLIFRHPRRRNQSVVNRVEYIQFLQGIQKITAHSYIREVDDRTKSTMDQTAIKTLWGYLGPQVKMTKETTYSESSMSFKTGLEMNHWHAGLSACMYV
jgi:hypothetical protein